MSVEFALQSRAKPSSISPMHKPKKVMSQIVLKIVETVVKSWEMPAYGNQTRWTNRQDWISDVRFDQLAYVRSAVQTKICQYD